MKYLAHIFIVLCFFPYVDLFNLGTDTQPTALIFAVIILLTVNKWRLNTPIILLGVLFVISLFFIHDTQLDVFTTAKIILNYLAPPIMSFAAYTVFTQLDYKLNFKVFLTILFIYFFVGFMQAYVINDFLAFLVNQGARGILLSGRGVVSLSPEPSFYGSICLFFMVFSFLNYSKKQNIFVAIFLLFQTIVLAKSSIALAILAFCIMLFGLIQMLRLRIKYVMTLGLGLLIIVVFQRQILESFEGTRMGEVMTEIIKDPLLIAKADPSIAVRFSGTFAPYFVARHNYFLPKGYGRFRSFLFELNGKGLYKDILTTSTLEQRQRIVGSINMAMFQLGFLGLLLPLAIYLAFKDLLSKDEILFSFLIFMSLLFTQIQLMHAMIGLIIGCAIFQSKKFREEKKRAQQADRI